MGQAGYRRAGTGRNREHWRRHRHRASCGHQANQATKATKADQHDCARCR